MSRPLSTAALRACLSQSTDQVFIECLEIGHTDLSEPIRVCNNTQQIVSGGKTFLPFRFAVTLPVDSADRLGELSLSISNVDRRIVEAARVINTAATATFYIVLASSPDTIEYGPVTMSLRNVRANMLTVTGRLRAGENLLYQKYPAHSFVPASFVGMFS
jgi:hypothetical protein